MNILKQQKLITAMRQAAHRARQNAALAEAREKAVNERTHAEIEMFCDLLRQEGIEPLSDLGRNCIVAFIASLSEETARLESIDAELDAFDKTTGMENW